MAILEVLGRFNNLFVVVVAQKRYCYVEVPRTLDPVDLAAYLPELFPLFAVHPGFPGFLGQRVRFLLELVFHGSRKFRPVGFPPVTFRLLEQVFKGHFNFPVIDRAITVFHAVTVDQAVFIVGHEKVNLVEVFRPYAVPARIAVNDRRHFRLLRHFLRVDFLIGEDPEIAAVLRVQAGAGVFVTAQLLGLVAAVTVYGVLVAVRRAVPLHSTPAGLRSHPVHFRFAGNLINRDAGN